MTMNVEAPKPMHAAAYQVIYERFLPVFCTSREREAEILEGFAEVLLWARDQPKDIRQAYEWACRSMTDDLARKMRIQEFQQKQIDMFKVIVRPPGFEPTPELPPIESEDRRILDLEAKELAAHELKSAQ